MTNIKRGRASVEKVRKLLKLNDVAQIKILAFQLEIFTRAAKVMKLFRKI